MNERFRSDCSDGGVECFVTVEN